MSQFASRLIGSLFALLFLGCILLAGYDSQLSPTFILGCFLGVFLGIVWCIAVNWNANQQVALGIQPLAASRKGFIAAGTIIGMTFVGGLRLFGVLLDVAVFLTATLGVCLGIFFIWLGWFFEPPSRKRQRLSGESSRWRPRDDAERDEERWRR